MHPNGDARQTAVCMALKLQRGLIRTRRRDSAAAELQLDSGLSQLSASAVSSRTQPEEQPCAGRKVGGASRRRQKCGQMDRSHHPAAGSSSFQ